jgi:hypothetical protein
MLSPAMPVRLRKLSSGRVRVSTPGGLKARAATPRNAARQARLLEALERDPEFRPRRRRRPRRD